MAEARHYMNKMFGDKLDKARDLDEKSKKRQRHGSVRRVTIEPSETGRGHRVTVERHGSAEGQGTTEHEFEHPAETSKFLNDVLSEGEGGAAGNAEGTPEARGAGGGPTGPTIAESRDEAETENEARRPGEEDEEAAAGRRKSRGLITQMLGGMGR